MPHYIVRVCKTELVLLSANVRIAAHSKKAAGQKVRRRLARGEEVEDQLWYESDSMDANEVIQIAAVWRDQER